MINLDAVLHLAVIFGWSVFPVRPDKIPFPSFSWRDESTNDPERIRDLWAAHPGANVAVDCGKSGLIVLDIDAKNGVDGYASLDALHKQVDFSTDTVSEKTPSGGLHMFYKMNGTIIKNSAGKLGPGLDIRGDGGYIVCAPSVTPEGGYRWIDTASPDDLAPLPFPSALADFLTECGVTFLHRGKTQILSEPESAYGHAALEGELAKLRAARNGERNDQLNRSAFALGQLVGAGELDRGCAETALTEAALSVGLTENETHATIRSGLDSGIAEPRIIPERHDAGDITEPGESLPCPPLPASARLPADLGRDASPWLDSYIAFSRRWSPRAFDGFHEACGLWVLSTVAARRVVLHLGKPFYTLLYIALTARTSLYAKSTTADIAAQTMGAAGLSWLLAADESTPQKFILDLTTRLPEDFDDLPEPEQERIEHRLATAGQRGWFYEEFGQHLESITREGGYMGEFRGLLRRFDDCKPRYEYATVGRGSNIVERPYLALLVSMTPADMRPIARRNAAMWNDGFFARFAFVTPPTDDRKRDRFPVEQRIIPPEIITPLVKWHKQLGLPEVTITDVIGEEGKPTGKKSVEVGCHEMVTCTLGAGVADAFYAYHDGLLDLVAQSDNQDLDGNYARFAEKAMRVAILLGSLENGNVIELRHWARAQGMAERWRANLHALFEQVNQPDPSEDAQNEERILSIVKKLGRPTIREITQRAWGLGTAQVKNIVGGLVDASALAEQKDGRTKRYCFPTESVEV